MNTSAEEQAESYLTALQDDPEGQANLIAAVLQAFVVAGSSYGSGYKFDAGAIESVGGIQYKIMNLWHPPRNRKVVGSGAGNGCSGR